MTPYPLYLNPFLVEDDNISSADSYNTRDLPPMSFAPPPLQAMTNLKLLAFWPDAPVAWFAPVEAQFRLCRVLLQDEWSCHLTSSH